MILYMEAEKNRIKHVFYSVLVWCKIAPLWSFNFLSKLMRAAKCVWFSLNPFCDEVHEGCLSQEKKHFR